MPVVMCVLGHVLSCYCIAITGQAESLKPMKCVTLGSGPNMSTNTNITHVFSRHHSTSSVEY